MKRVAAADVELVVDAHCRIGEGPSWDAAQDVLLFVDILGRKVHRLWPDAGSFESTTYDQQVGAVVPRAGGGLLLALEDGFWVTDPSGPPTRLAEVESADPSTRMNDGKCDRIGRFWAGTMAHDARPGSGTLYRLDPDGTVTQVVDRVSISNGLAWSPDDRRMYYIDSLEYAVDELDFDIESGQASNRRRLFGTPRELGLPDGMAVDAEGFLWIAFYGGWSVRRYSPEGTLDRVVQLPVQNVTSCAFGGSDLNDLYVTSATVGLTDEQLASQPHAGGLFVHRPGIPGLPETPFSG